MPVYCYTALSPRGRKIRGEQNAPDERALSRQLNKVGLQLLKAHLKEQRHELSLGDFLAGSLDFFETCVESLIGEPTKTTYDPKKFERGKKSRKDIRIRIPRANEAHLVTFDFCAKTPQGRRMYGQMEAADQTDLANRLLLIELTLVSAKLAGAKPSNLAFLTYRLSKRDEVILAQQFALYCNLDMGMPNILAAICVGVDSKSLRGLITGIRNHVLRGDNLAVAVNHYRHFFSQFFIAAIDIAHQTGHYSGVMEYANRHLKWRYDLSSGVKNELRGAIKTFVIVTACLPLLLVPIYHVLRYLLRMVSTLSALLARLIGRIIYEIPYFGKLSLDYDTLNFTYLFVMMWDAGIEVVPALQKAKAVIHNAMLRHEVSQIEDAVNNGSTLTDAFKQANHFPIELIAAIRSAEMTGNFSTLIDSYYFFATRRYEDALFSMTWKVKLLLLILSGISVMLIAGLSYPALK